ncbi:hypothetical protein BDU57DRAFT_512188 [Ampelomyces quisqualis]|uniref:Uncharacterized protein n=1 Tax=Ampelomyces quisqualis TaxID=50730 RepID=A0A6A5QTW0_AMPQU|nr:hypothetical protein BDU57DRAFT_512188 [Ampelomyces quisqualis]
MLHDLITTTFLPSLHCFTPSTSTFTLCLSLLFTYVLRIVPRAIHPTLVYRDVLPTSPQVSALRVYVAGKRVHARGGA